MSHEQAGTDGIKLLRKAPSVLSDFAARSCTRTKTSQLEELADACLWAVSRLSIQPAPAPNLSALWGLVETWAKRAQSYDTAAHFRDEPYDDLAHEKRTKARSLRKHGIELEAALLALGIPRPTPEGR